MTSPWLGMLRRVPAGAGWLDYAHVALGFAALVLVVIYGSACLRAGRRPLYFPWSPGGLHVVGQDLSGLLRGRVPAAEGGGLIGFIEGLLLVALAVTAASGGAWFLTQGSDAALAWRGHHILAAWIFSALLALHVVTVSLHLIELVRD
jgi:cytochrome b561